MAELTEEQKKRWGLEQQRIKEDNAFGQPVNNNTFDARLNTEPTEEAEEAPQASGMTLSDMLQQIQEEKTRREKDDAAAEKRGRIREMIGSIGDAAVALNNLYHTTQYAPAPKAAEGMGNMYSERNAQDKAWRDAHRKEWLNYALNLAGKKQAEEQHKETKKANEERAKAAREDRADTLLETTRHHKVLEAQNQERINKQAEDRRQRNEIAKIKAMKTGSRSGGSSKAKPILIPDEDGSTFTIPDGKDYQVVLASIYGFVPARVRERYKNSDPKKGIGLYLSDPNGDPDIKANMREALKELAGLGQKEENGGGKQVKWADQNNTEQGQAKGKTVRW